MSLARVKNWIVGEDLNADDLNAEFNNILQNPVSLVSPVSAAWDFDGVTITLDAAAATQLVSSAAVSFNFTSGAKAGTPATTGSVANWSAQTFTDSATAGSGTATAFVAHGIQRPTLAATNATVTTTDAATFYIANAPAEGTNETITSAWALWTDDGKVRHDLTATVASAAGAVLRGLYLPAVTETVTGSTNITTATGFNLVEIGIPTLSAASALTVTNAATVYISGAPTGGGVGPAAITNAYALWIDDGAVRFDGAATFNSTTTVIDSSFTVIGSADATKALRFEVDGFTTGNTRVLTPPNANLTLPNAATAGTIPITTSAGVLGMAAALNQAIYGLTYANGTDAVNDINFASGGCMDSTGVLWIACAAMAGKQLDVGWAPGAAAGMRNSGAAIADTDYNLFAVAKADGTQDYYAHTSIVVATVITALQAESGGADYLYARRIGWIHRTGGTIVAMTTYETAGGGLELKWTTPTLDINLANTLTTSRRTDAVKVPLTFSVIAELNVVLTDASTSHQDWIYCPDQADLAPSPTAAPLASQAYATGVSAMNIRVRTSATGTIAARSTLATVDLYAVSTMGFEFARRD